MKKTAGLFVVIILIVAASVRAEERQTPVTCTYHMQVWSVRTKQSIDTGLVAHSYSSLAPEEVDRETGCTVCSEDQIVINIPPLERFPVCYKLAPRVRMVVEELIRRRVPVFTIVGYHVIKSRGPLDESGNRTDFSNHSFGTAIDINPDLNGLYDHCVEFGPDCHLLRGGEWHPGRPGTLTSGDDVVSAFKSAGFRWGGEIAGKQKDFMHFSPSGY